MDGKTGLIVGIANERSYAYFIAESLLREGAECLFTNLPGEKMERSDAVLDQRIAFLDDLLTGTGT